MMLALEVLHRADSVDHGHLYLLHKQLLIGGLSYTTVLQFQAIEKVVKQDLLATLIPSIVIEVAQIHANCKEHHCQKL